MRVVSTPLEAAILNSAKLPRQDVDGQLASLRAHAEHLLSGAPTAETSWRSIADSSNMAETLAKMRIGGGKQALQIIGDAQRALAKARDNAKARGSWAMRAEDRDELREAVDWLLSLHQIQMQEVSVREYAEAFRKTQARMATFRRQGLGTRVVGDL